MTGQGARGGANAGRRAAPGVKRASTARPPAPPRLTAADQTYAARSKRPLVILAFLLPMLVLYEVGSWLYLRGESGVFDTIGAHNLLARFFELFGAVSFHLPGITLVVVLLTWHVLRRDPWQVEPRTLGGMAMESVAWTLPLVVLGVLLSPAGVLAGSPPEPLVGASPNGTPALSDLPWQARLTLSVGAGLYEELLFRMVGIAAAHTILADLLRVPERWAGPAAILISAIAFAWYHDAAGSAGQVRLLLTFYILSGVYFGIIYLARGFGIVVAVHALYDVFALIIVG